MASKESGSGIRKWNSASELWSARIRMCFWILGLLLGGILTYTTRHFINGDAIAYLDMAQAFRTGLWKESVFLGYSPGYSLLLAIFESIFQTTPDNELYMVKLFNFIVFIAAMITCDLFVRRLTDETDPEVETTTLPSYISKAMCYSAFLVASLIWVRVQLVTPDMIIFVFVLLSVVAVLNIKRSPDDVWNFVLLGVTTGFGYICKTFLFPFSVVLFRFCGNILQFDEKSHPPFDSGRFSHVGRQFSSDYIPILGGWALFYRRSRRLQLHFLCGRPRIRDSCPESHPP